jgi:endonuclease-3
MVGPLLFRLTRFYGTVKLPKKSHPFRVLVGFLLSQRTTDKITEKVEKAFFVRIRSVDDLGRITTYKLRRLIRPVNFHRTKARNLKRLAAIIARQHDGRIPRTRRELLGLPGVGHKTADGILLYGYRKPYFPVDTHLARVTRRIGLVHPSAKESEIADWFRLLGSKKTAFRLNRYLLKVGKDFCHSRAPKCASCPAKSHCRYTRNHLDSHVGLRKTGQPFP